MTGQLVVEMLESIGITDLNSSFDIPPPPPDMVATVPDWIEAAAVDLEGEMPHLREDIRSSRWEMVWCMLQTAEHEEWSAKAKAWFLGLTKDESEYVVELLRSHAHTTWDNIDMLRHEPVVDRAADYRLDAVFESRCMLETFAGWTNAIDDLLEDLDRVMEPFALRLPLGILEDNERVWRFVGNPNLLWMGHVVGIYE